MSSLRDTTSAAAPRGWPRRFSFETSDHRPGIVRVARNRDARACLRIVEEAVRERPRTLAVVESELWTPREWRRHRLDWSRHGTSLVAELDRRVVGHLTIRRGARPVVAHTAEWGVTVAREHRGVGVGRALIEAAERWALEHDVTRLVLRVFATNRRAESLYRSMGYVEEGVERQGVRFPEGPVDVIVMHKLLD